MKGGRRAAGRAGIAIVGSRVFGLVRELVFAAMFGAGKFLDSFIAAFQIPNLLRDLFAEGALSTAFTTVVSKTDQTEGEARTWQIVSAVVSLLLLAGGAVCLVGIAISPLLVNLTSFGFHDVPGKFELTVRLTRIMFPFILLVSLAAVLMGVLNSRYIFGIPATGPMAFNIVSVVSAVLLAYLFEPQADPWRPHFSQRALYGAAIGVLIGGTAQMGVQVWCISRLGYRFKWRPVFSDPALREIWALMWPSVIAGAAIQVNALVNGMFASHLDGARSWLNCAFRLAHLPVGVFGVSIGMVTLPTVARLCAKEDLPSFGAAVVNSLRLAIFLTVPAAVGLFVLAPDIVAIIYEHGRFTAADTARTALALRAYAVGLAGYAGAKVLVPCFYALGQRKFPLKVSLVAIAVNLVLNSVLVATVGISCVYATLAATTAFVATVNCVQYVVRLRTHVPFGSAPEWIPFLLQVAAGSAACALAAHGAVAALAAFAARGMWEHLAVSGAAVAAGAGAYALVTLALRNREAVAILRTALRQ